MADPVVAPAAVGSRHTAVDGATTDGAQPKPKKNNFWKRFQRQEFKGWSPIITANSVVIFYALVGLIMLPLGIAILIASLDVQVYRTRYDNLGPMDGLNTAAAQDVLYSQGGDGVPVNASITVLETMKAPVYFYYELDNYYQNYRRYVRSLSNKQLAGRTNDTASACQPLSQVGNAANASLPNNGNINPCGLIAWSNFNDSFAAVLPDGSPLPIDDSDIAWSYDADHLYGHYLPVNYNDIPAFRGGNSTTTFLDDSQHFMVWMRVASHPSFRKLFGVITEDIPAGTVVTFQIVNRYNTYNFDGKKWVVLSTVSWVGGKNNFLGIVYIILGGLSLLICLGFFVTYHLLGKKRPYGDLNYLSWNKKQH